MDLTDVIGRFGPWQKRILFVLLYRAVPAAFIIFNMQFMSPVIEHWCQRDADLNVTLEEWRSCCVPQNSKCEKYAFDSDGFITNATVKCDRWEFDENVASFSNIRKEWNLVCDRAWLVSLYYTAFIFGNFLSYIPSGHLADRYGRRTVSIIGMVAVLVFGVASYFSPNLKCFLAFRVICGLFYGLFQTATTCLYLESVGPEYRSLMALSFLGTWGLGIMVLPGLAYLANNWRTLQLITFVPFSVITPLLFWKFVPESPRWLLSVGKYEEAEKIIIDAAKMNKIEITDTKSIMKGLTSKIEEEKRMSAIFKKGTCIDLFRTKKIRKMTLLLYLSQFFTVFIYYGFSFTVGNLGGSLHFNIAIMGLTESLSAGIFLLMAKYITRRRALLLNFILSGLSFFLTFAVPDDLLWLRITIAMIGKMCNSMAYGFLWLLEAEIFPTHLRIVGVSGGMCAGRLGSVLATFMDEVARVAGNKIPTAVFGTLAITSSVLFLLLPETRDKHLPDTIKQSERLPQTSAPL